MSKLDDEAAKDAIQDEENRKIKQEFEKSHKESEALKTQLNADAAADEQEDAEYEREIAKRGIEIEKLKTKLDIEQQENKKLCSSIDFLKCISA